MPTRKSDAQETVTGSIRRALAESGKMERKPISLRLRHGLRDRVWGAAMGEKKPLNTMVNDLLERGLDARKPLEQVFGSVAGFAAARAILATAEVAAVTRGADQGLWLIAGDLETFDIAADAMKRAIDAMRPAPRANEALTALAEVEQMRAASEQATREARSVAEAAQQQLRKRA